MTGQQPFKGSYEQAVIYSILNEEPQPPGSLNTGILKQLEHVVLKALAKEPDDRDHTVDEMLADLQDLQNPERTGHSKTARIAGTGLKHISVRRSFLIASVLVLILTIAFLFLKPFLLEEPTLSAPRPLVVMPFENQTGDPDLDYLKAAIPNLLITNLEQSKYLSVLTWERMNDLLKQMGKDSVEVVSIDRKTGFELCKLDGVHGIVLGSFTRAGETFATDIKVLNVHDKKTLKSANSRGKGVASILETQIDELSNNISEVVVPLPEETATEELRLADVTTNSMEAFRFYFEGVSHWDDVHKAWAEVSLLKALDIDSTFAMAWYHLGTVKMRLSNIKLASEAFEKALKYSYKATEKEKLFINTAYAQHVENNMAKAISINEELVRKYPREKSAIFNLAQKYQRTGRIAEAIQAVEQGVALDPSFRTRYNNLGYLYAALRYYEKAQESFKLYIKYYPDNPNPYDSLAELYWMWGRLDDAIRLNKQAFEADSTWIWSFMRNAWNYALQDNYPQAFRELGEAARRNADMPPSAMKTTAGYYVHLFQAICQWILGRAKEAIANLSSANELARSRSNATYMIIQAETLARLYSDIGQPDKAEETLRLLLKIGLRDLPADSIRWHLKYNIISGTFDMVNGRTELAKMKILRARQLVQAIEHPTVEIDQYNLRLFEGELKLAEGRVNEAIEIFAAAPLPNPYIENRYLDYLIPFRQDGLARAYHADAELPEFIDARAQLAKLQGKTEKN